MRFITKTFALAAVSALTLSLSGCFFDDKEDKDSSQSTAEGTQSLELAMSQLTSGEFQYGNQDQTALRNANAAFRKSVGINPNDGKARFGLALTEVLLGAQAPQVSSQINALPMESVSPFSPDLAVEAPLARIAVLRKVAASDTIPEFHEIQDAIADTLLPALDEAITNLKAVYDDPAFSMTLTIDGAVREIDHGEVGVILAGFKATRALATLFLSYDYDIDKDGSYDFIDDLNSIGDIDDFSALTPEQDAAVNHVTGLLTPGSPFLAVRADWQTRLDNVDSELLEALNIAKAGLSSIKTETDPQGDDILHLCSVLSDGNCIPDDGFDGVLSVVDSGIYYMQHPYAVELAEIDTTIQVNFAAAFGIGDYKKLLPYYKFYPSVEWDSTKPVIYFTDAAGNSTGDLNTVGDILEDTTLADNAAIVARLKTVIKLQDPTFQGFLPGATEAGVWRLVEKLMDNEESSSSPPDSMTVPAGKAVAKLALSPMSPTFALSLLGK